MDRARRPRGEAVAVGAVIAVALAGVAWIILGRVGAPDVPAEAAPTATAPPSASSPAEPGGACTVAYEVTGEWPGGFGAELAITSATGTGAGWDLLWSLPQGEVTELWNATLVGSDAGAVHVVAPDWDPDLAAGETVTIGFNGTRGTTTPRPQDVTLDGAPCAGSDAARAPVVAGDGPTASAAFYLDPQTQAAVAAGTATGPERDAALLIAAVPQARWVLDPDPAAARAQVADYTGRAAAAGATGVLVVYAVPGRDCGAHSAGGTAEQAYRDWVTAVAAGMTGEPWVVLEPDALAQLGDCDGQGDRVGLLRDAARLLDEAGARVYLDAGHAAWLPADEAAERIRAVGTDHLAGFALNTSNDRTTAESREYGDDVSARLGGLHYVVDTSRNGAGPGDDWCNGAGRALGEEPRAGDGALDALLWVKNPGESDGTCGGGPAAGQWWPAGARSLVETAPR